MVDLPESPNSPPLKSDQHSRNAILLDPCNFTSLRRTPWAGSVLASTIKKAFAHAPTQKIGESWEVSCDPEAPSRLSSDPNRTLAELIQTNPEIYLSRDMVAAGRTSCDILVKLLNADSPLSLQIHPSDDHPDLKPSECGKPESWLILNAAPGAGLYLGFRQPLPVDEIRRRLESESFTSDLLQFVPVAIGDYFEIEPHVPHAIGPGVTLLEPQRIIAGKSGKTWRLWDWNRRYNNAGDLDLKNGSPRDLHVSQSMPLLNPEHQSGDQYVASLRRKPKIITPLSGVSASIFPANNWYQVVTLDMHPWSKIRLKTVVAYACVTPLAGRGQVQSPTGAPMPLTQGQSCFFPSGSLPLEISCRDVPLSLSLVIPAGFGVSNHDGLIFE